MGLKGKFPANKLSSSTDTNATMCSNVESSVKQNGTPTRNNNKSHNPNNINETTNKNKHSTKSRNHPSKKSAVPNLRSLLRKCMSNRRRTFQNCSQPFRKYDITTLAKQAWAVDKMTKIFTKLTLLGFLVTIITPPVAATPSLRQMSTNPLPPTVDIVRSNEPILASFDLNAEPSSSLASAPTMLRKTESSRVKRSSKSGAHKCVKRKQTDHVTLVHFSRWVTKPHNPSNSSSTSTPMFHPSGVPLRGLLEHELAMIADFDEESGAQDALHTVLGTGSGSSSGSKPTFPKDVTPTGNKVRPLLAGHKICGSAPEAVPTGSANVMELSLCPWYWEMNFDPTRIPTMLPEAKCRCKKARNEDKYDCHEAKIELRVMKFDPTCGGYKPSTVDIAVACIATVPHEHKTDKRRHGEVESETADTEAHS